MDNMGEFEGSVAPSYLTTNGQASRAEPLMRNLPMRVGRILRTHRPADEANYSKTFIEYDVLVEVFGENQAGTSYVIPHCIVMSAFGGTADYTRWTPRTLRNLLTDDDYGQASQVCVLMTNGSTFGGIIIGGPQLMGAQDRRAGTKDDPDDGHNRVTVFNGMRETVDNDGQYTLYRQGATDAWGSKLSVSDPEGTKLQMLTGGDLVLDSRHDLRATSDNNVFIEAGQQTTIRASLADMQLKAATVIQTTSPFVKLGAGTNAMMMGTTYRAAEISLHATMAAFMTSMATLLSGLASCPANVPFFNLQAGPGPAVVPATPLLIAAAASASALAAAISAFEAAAPSYLSLHNSLD